MSKHSEDGILPIAHHPPASSTSPASGIRHEYPVFVGEFIGTFMFLFLAFSGTQIAIVSSTIESGSEGSGGPDLNTFQQVSKLIYISFAFGAALAVNVSIFAEISGGMFNPAVSYI